MYVIQLFEDYWLRDGEGQVEEINDLEAATKFKTKKAAKEVVSSITFSEYCKIKNLSDVLPEFLEWKQRGMVRREIPKISKKSRKYDGEGLEEVIAFHKYHKDHEREVRHEDWSTWPNVGHFLECFHDMERYHSEDYTKTMDTFKLKVERTAEYKTFKKELKILLPHITHIDEDGFAIMSIFDHELSYHETRYFLYDKNSVKDEHHIKNHYDHVLFSGTLKQCFEEIRTRYYYE
jgi:hypothetical protein